MRILILSRSENVHADAVEKYCGEQAVVSRINFDFDKTTPDTLPQMTFGNISDMDALDAVFVHHPRTSYQEVWFADDLERRLFVASWDSVKEWMEAQFPRARWINKPSANARSRNVLHQLRLAVSLGLKTPDTLFTNSLTELKVFAGSDTVVIKQGNLGVHLYKKRILTSMVDVLSIEESTLQGCPCLFQRYVPKQFELRVHVIGNKVLTCQIDSQVSAKTRIDWRNYDLENTPHAAYELDVPVSEKCIELTRQLGLEFGVIDLIVTPQNECVFLECNAQGHWAWIEERTDLPITKTLCEYLMGIS